MLKRELGLAESDIVDIPQLFFLKNFYAEAFFPDMVRALGQGPAGGVCGALRRSTPWPRAGWCRGWRALRTSPVSAFVNIENIPISGSQPGQFCPQGIFVALVRCMPLASGG